MFTLSMQDMFTRTAQVWHWPRSQLLTFGRVHFAAPSSAYCSKLFFLLFEKEDREAITHGQAHTCFEQYQQQWDGMVWFPEYGLVVPSCLGTFDLHALAKLSPKEDGVLHGLVSPEMATNLEDTGIKATGTTKPAASSTLMVSVMCNELKQNVTVKGKM
jgi:hypothetical protein